VLDNLGVSSKNVNPISGKWSRGKIKKRQ